MILITDLKIRHVPDGVYGNILHGKPKGVGVDSAEEHEIHKHFETIEPVRFYNYAGERFSVGIDKQSQEILGSWVYSHSELQKHNDHLLMIKDSFEFILNASLWTRFKWLFTGVKTL